MTTINKTIKHQLALHMVMDAIERRVRNLHEDTSAHWITVAKEIMHSQAIKDANAAVDLLRNSAELSLTMIALDIDFDMWDQKTIMGVHKLLTFDAVGTRNNDPLDVIDSMCTTNHCGYDVGQKIKKEIHNLWKTLEPIRVVLPLPLLSVREVEDDEHRSCMVDDENALPSNTMQLDLENFIPEDCTTQKRFNKRAKKLGNDASKLYTNIMESIALSRSDTAIIDIIPEMKPYLDAMADNQNKVSNLLHTIQAGE